jgi:hypothetical protein
MQEICQSGSEGGGTEINRFSLPLSDLDRFQVRGHSSFSRPSKDCWHCRITPKYRGGRTLGEF